ncbi:GGDEF domain family protein [Desulfamplus magnetovallimortis]|uniref:GGDEF domain family protein n=1 Tax=Desulfamplus magnetovallimortis TaxID=1246637 RepID=A0A1W1HIV2_9BACT|nr:GAF domain-containing protein [Desulfamplus magnetovallimortis]SLM32335.1 GGDEF domain family protein [Desulfamplus magnetovallimortis]
MNRDTDYFDIFCKLSRAFGTAATQNELLNLVVDSAIITMDAKASCLFLSDDKNDFFVPVAQKGLSENYFHASPLKAMGIVKAIEKDGFLLFKDATTDPRLENHDAKKEEGIATIISVQIRVKRRTIGILSIYTATPRDYTEREIAFLRALADQAGIAIHNNRLLSRIEKNATLFLDFASSINSTLDIQKILKRLTEELCDTFGMKGAAIRLIDEDNQTMKLVASHGLSNEFLEIRRTINTNTTARALKGETVIVTDAATDQRLEFREEMKKEGLKSMIVTPITVKDKVIGVMRLYSAEQRDFPNDMLLIVEAIAQQGGLAIQNASMYMQLQDAKKSLEEDVWSHRSWF